MAKVFKEQMFQDYMTQIYYDMLSNIAISNIRWDGVPESIDLRYIEHALYYQGRCLFFRDEGLRDYAWLEFTESGFENIYNNPTSFVVSTASGYYNDQLTIYNSVPVYANMLKKPEFFVIKWFSQQLSDLNQKISANIENSCWPVTVMAPKEMEFTLKNAIKQKEKNVPVVLAKKGFEDIKVIPMMEHSERQFIADKLQVMYEKKWNEALTYLGISNLSVTKKERLISDEVQKSQGGTIASRNSRLLMRQYGADQINKMFGLNISVSFRDIFMQGGVDDEFLYNDIETFVGKTGRDNAQSE